MEHAKLPLSVQTLSERLFSLNPYNMLKPDEETRTVRARVSPEDFNLVRYICADNGLIQTVISVLWNKLANECRTRNITDVSAQEEFLELLTTSRLTLPNELGQSDSPGSPVVGSPIQTNVGDVRRGTTDIRSPQPSVTNLVADFSSVPNASKVVGRKRRKKAVKKD